MGGKVLNLNPEIPQKNTPILIVDDDKTTVRLLRHIFENAGYQVLTAENGEEGLRMERENKVNLVLMDVMMPKMNGYEFCKALRQHSNAPVIFISCLSNEEDALKGFAAGADDFIRKPFRSHELLAKINRLVSRFECDRRDADQKLKVFKENISNNLSHEMKTPISVISLCMESLLEEHFLNNPEGQQQFIGLAKKNVGRLKRLVEDFLLVNAFENGEFQNKEMVAIDDFLNQYIPLWKTNYPKHEILLEKVVADNQNPLYLPKFLLESGVAHLVDNACKFSPNSTKVFLQITAQAAGSENSPSIAVRVRDLGIGIPSSFHERIFEKHFQVEGELNRSYAGLGLGLYLFRHLLDYYHGNLLLESSENVGTTIGFVIPMNGH
jgi:DNA-binding response OmpR family regulator